MINENSTHSSADDCKQRNADFRDGYAKAIADASDIAMNMPLSKEWTEITDRISETTVQAMAWRTVMAILKKVPKPANSNIGECTPYQEKTLEVIKEQFARELLKLLAEYPEIFVFGREYKYGIGCGEGLRLKLMELAKTDAERTAAMNVVGVSYRSC